MRQCFLQIESLYNGRSKVAKSMSGSIWRMHRIAPCLHCVFASLSLFGVVHAHSHFMCASRSALAGITRAEGIEVTFPLAAPEVRSN